MVCSFGTHRRGIPLRIHYSIHRFCGISARPTDVRGLQNLQPDKHSAPLRHSFAALPSRGFPRFAHRRFPLTPPPSADPTVGNLGPAAPPLSAYKIPPHLIWIWPGIESAMPRCILANSLKKELPCRCGVHFPFLSRGVYHTSRRLSSFPLIFIYIESEIFFS